METEMDFWGFAIAVRCMRLLKKSGNASSDENTPKFPAYAWPGGYTVEYVTKSGEVICADCVNDPSNSEENFGVGDRIEAVGTYDEGPTQYCANCNAEIESSYGDPDNDSDKD